MRCLVLYYHLISDEAMPHVRHLHRSCSIRKFNTDLEAILRHHQPVSLADLAAAMCEQRRLPRNAVHFTFDDGLRQHAEIVAPRLLVKGVPATFFISTAFIDNRGMFYRHLVSLLIDALHKDLNPPSSAALAGRTKDEWAAGLKRIAYAERSRCEQFAAVLGVDAAEYLRHQQPYLTTEQLRELARAGFAIGGHGVDHPDFAELDEPAQLGQTAECMQWIMSRLPQAGRAFAFPFNHRAPADSFYGAAHRAGLAELFFGTEGVGWDPARRLVQRIGMDKPHRPAEVSILRALRRVRRARRPLDAREACP